RPLAMSANWELALTQARGEFVTIIGDDDGLMPDCLAVVDHQVRETGARAVAWSRILYTWPCLPLEGQCNYLRIPLFRWRWPIKAGDRYARGAFDCDCTLPSIYHGFIHRDLIAAAREPRGKVFVSRYPDTYTGFVFGHLAGSHPYLGVPLSV